MGTIQIQITTYKPLAFSFSRASSGTVINKDGLIETVGSGEPRIDFKDNTKGSLLLEPSRTNYVLKSNDFSLLYGGFVTPNYGTSPEGLSVSRILFTAANQVMGANTSLATGVVCNFSAYVKGVKGQFIKFAAGGLDITHTFSGEWERLSGSATSINSSWNFNTFGGATARDFLMCAAQLEQGSYATSYIPTSGSAVTRVEDNAYQKNVTQVIGQSEGTMFIDFIPKSKDDFQILYQIRTTGGSNVGQIDVRLQSGNIRVLGNDGGSGQFSIIGTSFDVGVRYKCAVRYKENDVAFYINSVLIGTDLSASFNSSFKDQVSFGENLTSLLPIANIIDARLYNNGLSNAELQALTQ